MSSSSKQKAAMTNTNQMRDKELLPCLPASEVFHELVTYNRNHSHVEFDFFLEMMGDTFAPAIGQMAYFFEKVQIDVTRNYFSFCVNSTQKNPCYPIRFHWTDPTFDTTSKVMKMIAELQWPERQSDTSDTTKNAEQLEMTKFAEKHGLVVGAPIDNINNKAGFISAIQEMINSFPRVTKEISRLRNTEFAAFEQHCAEWTYESMFIHLKFVRFDKNGFWYAARRLVDVYTVARMLKQPKESKKLTNIIFYGGAGHTDVIQHYLFRLGFSVLTNREGFECDKNEKPRVLKSIVSAFVKSSNKIQTTTDSTEFVKLTDKFLMHRKINGVKQKAHLRRNDVNIILIGENHTYTNMRVSLESINPNISRRIAILFGTTEHINNFIVKFCTKQYGRDSFTTFELATPVGQEVFKKTVSPSNYEYWFPKHPILIFEGDIFSVWTGFERLETQLKNQPTKQWGNTEHVRATEQNIADMKNITDNFKLQTTNITSLHEQQILSQMSSKKKMPHKKKITAKTQTIRSQQPQNEFVQHVWAIANSFHSDRADIIGNEPQSGWKQQYHDQWRHYLTCRADAELRNSSTFDIQQDFFYYATPKQPQDFDPSRYTSDNVQKRCVSNKKLPVFQPLEDEIAVFTDAVTWAHRFIPKGAQQAKIVDFDLNMYDSDFFKGAKFDCIPKETQTEGDGACLIHSVGYCFDVASGMVKQNSRRTGKYSCGWAWLLRNLLTDIEWKAAPEFDFSGGHVVSAITSAMMGRQFSHLPPFNTNNNYESLAALMQKQIHDHDVDKVVFDYTIAKFREQPNGWRNWSSTTELYLLASILCIDFTVFITTPRDGHRVIDAVKHYPVHHMFRNHVRGHGFLHFNGGHFDVVKFTHYPTNGKTNYTADRKQYINPNSNGCVADANLANELRNFIQYYDEVKEVKTLLVAWYDKEQLKPRTQFGNFDPVDHKHLKLINRPIKETQTRATNLARALNKKPPNPLDRYGNGNPTQITKDSVIYWMQMTTLFTTMENDCLSKFRSNRITGKWVDVMWPPPNSNQAESLAAAKTQSTIEDIRREYGLKAPETRPKQPKQPKQPEQPEQPKQPEQGITKQKTPLQLQPLQLQPKTQKSTAYMSFIATAGSLEELVRFTIGSYQDRNSARWGTTEISRIDNQPVSGDNLKPLLSMTDWINDNVINAFLRLITRDFTQFVHFEASTTLLNFKSKKTNFSGSYDKENLMNNGVVAPYWFMPESVAKHWWLNIVNVTDKWILRCDSLSDDMDETVLNYLETFHKAKRLSFNREAWAYGNIRQHKPTTAKTQTNANSYNLLLNFMTNNRFGKQKTSQCGVYTCIVGLKFMLGKSFEEIRHGDMNEYNGWRAFVRKSLLMRKLWTADPPRHTEKEIHEQVQIRLDGNNRNNFPTVEKEEDEVEEERSEDERSEDEVVVVEEERSEDDEEERSEDEEEGGDMVVIAEEGDDDDDDDDDDDEAQVVESDEAESPLNEGNVRAKERQTRQSANALATKLTNPSARTLNRIETQPKGPKPNQTTRTSTHLSQSFPALIQIVNSIQKIEAKPKLQIVFHQYRANDPNTDYVNMIKNPTYNNALFIFNDNEEAFESYLRNEKDGFKKGGNNAKIRPFRRKRNELPNIRVAGIPTGRGGKGYTNVTKDSKAKTAIDTSIRLIFELLLSNQYDKLIIPSSWDKVTKKFKLGTAIFGVGDAVTKYIFDELETIVNIYHHFNSEAERWVNPPQNPPRR